MIYNIDDEIRSRGRHRGETIREIARYDSGYIKDRIKKDKSFMISGQCFVELARITAGCRDNWEKPKSSVKNIFHALKSYGTPYMYDFKEDKDMIRGEAHRKLLHKTLDNDDEANIAFWSMCFEDRESSTANGDESEDVYCETIELPQLEDDRYLGISLLHLLSSQIIRDEESIKNIVLLAYHHLSKAVYSKTDYSNDLLPIHKRFGDAVGDRLYRVGVLLEYKESFYGIIRYIRQKKMDDLGFDHVSWGPIEDDDSIDKMIFADLMNMPQSLFDNDYPQLSALLEKLRDKLVRENNSSTEIIAKGCILHEQVNTRIDDILCGN